MICLGPKFWLKVIFWVYERRRNFLGREENKGIFGGCEKRTKGFFFGMLKKVVIFIGRQILKL